MNIVEPKTKVQSSMKIISDGKITFPATVSTRNNVNVSIGLYKYILNSNDSKGYALVCDDVRYPKVVAYCPEGNLSDTIFNKGLARYMRELPDKIVNKINKTTEILSNPGKYKNILNNVFNKVTTRFPYWGGGDIPIEEGHVTYLPEYNKTEVKGDTVNIYSDYRIYAANVNVRSFRVPVKWGQGYPYNKNVPYNCGSGKAPAGCVAIAMAQIMSYHKKPSNYNWNLLTQTPTISGYSPDDETRRMLLSM